MITSPHSQFTEDLTGRLLLHLLDSVIVPISLIGVSPFRNVQKCTTYSFRSSFRASVSTLWKSSAIAVMETLLRQSRSMCPFLNKTSPATLRSLSTSTRPASSGGGSMSNLQVLARRCPIMGKAMAVQTVKSGNAPLGGVYGGIRAYGGKANLHTTRSQSATVDSDMIRPGKGGMSSLQGQWVIELNSCRACPTKH